MALDVGKIFYSDKKVMAYSNLGIGRLIYQLPLPLCKMFIKEIFDDNTPDNFDEETLTTINKFFENNLNISEIIIVDLDSTDNTLNILKTFSKDFDFIKVLTLNEYKELLA